MILLFDGLLILSLLWLAWRSLASEDLFQAIVLFIAFGLLMALVWARLNAPDIALAEAAIGSGLTGALFLATLGRLDRLDKQTNGHACLKSQKGKQETGSWLFAALVMLALAGLTVAFAGAIASLPAQGDGLVQAVFEHIKTSGVQNPVTAVLLNFRSYDTMLEIAVLLLATISVWSLSVADTTDDAGKVRIVQTALVHLLSPVMLLVAGFLLWIGSSAPGGAFQAGAMLGGLGVLLILSNPNRRLFYDSGWIRGVLALGAGGFMVVGLLVMGPDSQLLQYPLHWAKTLILFIETIATISIGATLVLLFAGGRPKARNADDVALEPGREA